MWTSSLRLRHTSHGEDATKARYSEVAADAQEAAYPTQAEWEEYEL